MSKVTGTKKRNQQRHSKNALRHNQGNLPPGTNGFFYKWGAAAILALGAIIVLQSRIQLLAIPLERDEAGFAYIGHWLLRGKELYVDMVDNKLPGLYMLYALITSLFGYNATGVHIGLLLVNIASGVCFYLLLREVYNKMIAALATAFFLLLVTAPNVVGFAAHATQILLPFVLGGFLLFWRGISSGKRHLFFFAGLLLGFAFMIKQQSVVFGILAAGFWWPLRIRKGERIPVMEWVLLGIGGLLPVAITISYFYLTGHLNELFFWTYLQPAGMAATFNITRSELFFNIFPKIIVEFVFIWIVAAAGLIAIWLSGFHKNKSLFGVLLGVLGLGSVVIGAAFYNHYFILAMPGIALLAAFFIYWLSMRKGLVGEWLAFGLAIFLLLWPVIKLKEYFFKPDYAVIHQKAYNQNLFPEIERIGEELAKRVKEGDRIAVLGSEPGVLMAADREGCSKHLFMYPLLSDPKTSPALQQEFIQELQNCSPEYIVWNNASGSWSTGYEELKMFKELMVWAKENYATIGLAEFRPGAPGYILWDRSVTAYKPKYESKVYVLKRRI